MEKKNKRAVIVGIFVFLALVIFVLAVMTLGGQKSLFNEGARVHATFNDVNGLQPGNNVRFAGVKVGTVDDVYFTENGQVHVSMRIEKDYLPVIKTNTRAKVGSDGFIGNKIVVLVGGTATAPPIKDGTQLQVESVVSTEEMMATLQENNQNILAITTDFKSLSGDLANGNGTIGKLLKSEQLYNDLQLSMISLRQASAEAQGMIRNLTNYTARLNNKGSLTNDLVTDTVIFARLRSAVREIDALSSTATQVVNDLNRASSNISSGLGDSSTTFGLLLHDRETASDIKQTIENLRMGTKKLDENMEALQSNFLLRGFFKKRNSSR